MKERNEHNSFSNKPEHRIYNVVDVGKRIKAFRIEAGYTQEEVAEILGLDRSYLGQVESGRRGCSIDIFVLLGELLNVSLDQLILGKDLDREWTRKKVDELIQHLESVRDMLQF